MKRRDRQLIISAVALVADARLSLAGADRLLARLGCFEFERVRLARIAADTFDLEETIDLPETACAVGGYS